MSDMSYSYNPFLSDLDRVRFHIGDTDSTAPRFSDEEIAAILIAEGSWQRAVIACLRALIARLSVPAFRADWLQVDPASARAGYERLLWEKRAEFGFAALRGSVKRTYRPDTEMTDPNG